MTFGCPQCKAGTLRIERSLALPADSRSDDILVQQVTCAACGFGGAAVYEESRRGALDSEAWDHTGWELGPAALAELEALLAGCPQPNNPACGCPAHQSLGRTDGSGRWAGLAGTRAGFPMVRAHKGFSDAE